jgi:Domain of unknown function (DUF6436)
VRHALNIDDRILWLVVIAWLGVAAYGVWFFDLRFERQFVSTAHATLFESGSEAPEAEDWFRRHFGEGTDEAAAPIATVVHLYDASCPCNRFTDPHLARIQVTYRPQHVRVIRVERTSPIGAGSPGWIEATPAALVFDAHGKLLYFGPYSDTAACGTSNGLVERVLNQVLSGKSPRPQLVISGGCFCAHKPRQFFGIQL